MYSAVAQVRISASVQYSSFLQLYAFVATLEFLLLMFIMPALTSGSTAESGSGRHWSISVYHQDDAERYCDGKTVFCFEPAGWC